MDNFETFWTAVGNLATHKMRTALTMLGMIFGVGAVIAMLSIGAGGGSIAWINPIGNQLNVGPRSAGSMPGPVCYDQGGTEPTVTDADVVLGYINPDTYYGGRMPLSRAKAERDLRI